MKKIKGAKMFFLLAIISTSVHVQPAENPRFRLSQLEIRTPREETYVVPANIDAFRQSRNISLDSLRQFYLENCKALNIQPFQFEQNADFYRELYKMQLIWLGLYSYPGYQEATDNFFNSIEKQLANNPEVLKKYQTLFKRGGTYITKLWDFILEDLSHRSPKIKLHQTAQAVANLESYNKRFSSTKYLKKEEWSHPAYLFYQLDHYRERKKDVFESITKDLKARHPSLAIDMEAIFSAYEKGLRWVLQATQFFLEEKWFYNEKTQEYLSVKDFIRTFWEPILGLVPSMKPGILRLGEVDGTARGAVPYLEYPQFLQPLNSEGERFLKETPASKINDAFEPLGDVEFADEKTPLPAGFSTWPLRMFINSLKQSEKDNERSTFVLDVGCPLTMLIANIPHELSHFFYFVGLCYWKKGWRGNSAVYYQCVDSYKSEGVAELGQALSVERILEKFPMLRHDNLLKHYIFSRDPGDHHTWGWIWLRTVYEILDKDMGKTFFLASEPGLTFEEFLGSPWLQTEEVRKQSKDMTPVSFPRQKKRSDRLHTYIFPSCIVEIEGEAFKIISHDKIEF